ncbi:MAG: PIN domain-containing protein [Thermoguttaceae bacterium]
MYLIDTDVLVHLLRGNATVIRSMAAHADDFKAISATSFGELIYGCHRSNHRAENAAKVYHVAANFPIVAASESIIDRYGVMKADLVNQGRKLEDFDLVIAATALHLGYTLVTGNARHFDRVPGLRIENWAEMQA